MFPTKTTQAGRAIPARWLLALVLLAGGAYG